MNKIKFKNSKLTQELKLKYLHPTCYVLAGMAFYYAYVYLYMWEVYRLGLICILGGAAAFIVPFFSKKTNNYYIVSNIVVSIFFVVITATTYYGGGIKSNSIWWFGSIPLVATFLLNASFGLIWFLVMILDFVAMLYLGRYSMLPESNLATIFTETRFIRSFAMNSFLIFILSALTDLIAEKAQSENEDMKLKAFQLKQISSLGKMASGVSHEINNPLTVIKGYENRISKMLENKMEIDPELLEEYLKKIRVSVQRIEVITSMMRSISEQEHNREITEFDLSGVIDDVKRILNEELSKKTITMNISCSQAEYKFKGIYTEIFQAIFNLIDFSLERLSDIKGLRVLSINIRQDDKSYVLTIQDNGDTLSADIKNHLFDPFHSSELSIMGKRIGLLFSMNVFHSNGGNLELIEPLAHGNGFKITLPRSAAVSLS